jgi:hypothetical protein
MNIFEALWHFATYAAQQFATLNERITEIMTSQGQLDADVAALNTALGAISDEITNLKNQPAAANLDLTGLDAAVSTAQGLVPAPAAPTTPDASTTTPVDAPTPPSQ